MTPIEVWLESLKLGQYIDTFLANDVDLEVLPDLDESDLEKLGVSLGHRKKILKAIACGELTFADPGGGNLAPSENAEYRFLTIMFCDLVGSTELTARLGAENMRELNRVFHHQCKSVISSMEGYIARYMGDGVLAYFGFPFAQEDAAERAVLAALDIIENVSAVKDTEAPLQVRIGIATGQVIVDHIGDAESRERSVVGEAPNLAARLQGLAIPNSLVIAQDTKQLVGGAFEFKDLGRHQLKGIAEPVIAWQVTGRSHVESRFAATRGASSVSGFVNRHEDLNLLMSRWQDVLEGEGQAIVLSGEAGIGKSRMLEVLVEKIKSRSKPFVLRLNGSPYHRQSVLYPVIECLNRLAGATASDTVEQKIKVQRQLLLDQFFVSDEIVDSFIKLSSVPTKNQTDIDSDLTPQEQLALLLDAVVEFLLAKAMDQPVLVVVEDSHWIDPSTQHLLELLVDQVTGKQILVLITSRPENSPRYQHSHVTRCSLNKLSRKHIHALIENIATGSQLPNRIVDNIKSKSDGIPLYAEEITKMLMAVKDEESDRELNVPDTLQASLLARLDRLGEARQVALIASVVGSNINEQLITNVSDRPANIVKESLRKLADHNVLSRTRSGANTFFEFRHALLKDAAYESLLKSDRIKLHLRIAEHLCTQQDVPPELIAYHFSEAGEKNRSFEYWLAAGRLALERGATVEAVELFNQALPGAPQYHESLDQVLLRRLYDYQMSYGKALNAVFGAASMKAHTCFRRAQQVSQSLQDMDKLVDALDYQFGITFNAGMLEQSIAPAQAMIEIGETSDHMVALISGYQCIGMTHFAQGQFDLAHHDLLNCLNHKDKNISGVNCFPSMAMTYLSYVLYILGQSEQARLMCQRALQSAREESVRSTATALSNCCYTLHFLHDINTMSMYSDELISLSDDKGMYMFKNRGLFFSHLTKAERDKDQQSLKYVSDAVESLLASKEEIETTFFLGIVAELQIELELLDDARASLDRAFSIARKNGEMFFMAELLRLDGLLQLRRDTKNIKAAARLFDQSIKLAEQQSAQSWVKKSVQAKQFLSQ